MLFPSVVQRYVVDLGGAYSADEDGIRSDTAWWAPSTTKRSVADLSRDLSFALLGEPGIGKSTTIGQMVDDDLTSYVRLDEATDVRALDALLAPTVSAPSGERRTLVLDGIDECPLAPKTLVRRVVDALSGRSPVRVIVGCRTADWPTSLGDGLRELLGSFEVLELLPLSGEDIVTLAESRGVDGARFLKAVRDAAAGPFATLPLTLDLLLNLYVQEGGLPADPRELYERGLMLLADEPDQDRAAERKPAGTDAQRLAIAARIAAALMLCGQSAVTIVGPSGDGLPVGGFSAGTEPLAAGEFAVTAELVRGSLATGLFSGRGPRRLGVSHASFAAYLTARYLYAHRVPEHQLRALLTRTSSVGRTRVPTRLRETAAWLVALDPDHNSWIVDLDPDAVLAHSALVEDDRVRATLVSGLLNDGDITIMTSRRRWRLPHPGLADQLRPALLAPLNEDAGPHFGHPVSRRAHTAIEIARRSGLRDAGSEITDLVACADLNPYLRNSAAHGLVELDPDRAAPVLRKVLNEVMEHPDRDPHDDLRGVALETCWPAALTVPELVGALTVPREDNYIGSYKGFLHQFVEELTDEAVEQLVRAVASVAGAGEQLVAADSESRDGEDSGPQASLLTGMAGDVRLKPRLLERVLASPQLEAIVDETGWLIADCIRHHERCALPKRFAVDDRDNEDARDLRHALVLATLRYLAPARASLLARLWTLRPSASGDPTPQRLPGLVGCDDFAWLFTLAYGPYGQHVPALIRAVYDPADPVHQEIAWEHREQPVFAASVGHWFEAVDLAGPAAAQMREEHEWASRPSWVGAESHPAALVDAWTRCNGGDAAAFADLCLLLRTDPTTGTADRISDDIARWPSFGLLDADADELATAACAYLAAVDPSTGNWLLNAGSISYAALDGYAGLSLIARRPDAATWFNGLPDGIWARWAPAVVRCPMSGDEDSRAVRSSLLDQLAIRVPDVFADAYMTWMEQGTAAGWSIPALEPLVVVYDHEVGDRLGALLPPRLETMNSAGRELLTLTTAADDPVTQKNRTELTTRLNRARQDAIGLAGFLSGRHHGPTISLLETVLGSAEQPGSSLPEARAVAAAALVSSGQIAWAAVFSDMQADEEFGSAVAYDLARGRADAWPLHELDEAQLGDLWMWLHTRWSTDTDTFANGFLTDNDAVRRWRDDILDRLSARTTPEALSTLAALADAHPDDAHVRSTLREAETRQRDESWHGPTFEELAALVADARRTVVHDDDALYRLVLSVLERFAARLKDVGQLLWNETRPADGAARKVWRPKYEPDVSAFLKDHLEQEFADRLVVNREVLVRQTTSKGHGLSVDILASGGAPQDATSRLPQCPIEVKGSWNPGLLTDLKAQLVDDYLPAVGASRGVYVCAWFSVDDWDDDADTRRDKASTRDRDTITRDLHDAAERASTSPNVHVAAIVVDVPRPIPSARKQSAT